MKIADVAKLPSLERFLYWIREREAIRLRRTAGEPKPWTDDEILQRYRFCNVRRMDDRVSQWLLKNWYEPNYNHPNALIACGLARFFNLPATLERIGYPVVWDASRARRIIRYHQRRGRAVFNGAYMVRGNDGVDKVGCVINYTIQQLAKQTGIVDISSMRATWERLIPVRGLGSFMAGQIVADLRWAMEGKWGDRCKWAPLGPGSRRGMNRLMSEDKDNPLKQEQFEIELATVIEVGTARLPPELTGRLEAIDWQNCLCEFDKYERALGDEGRPKQLYPGV